MAKVIGINDQQFQHYERCYSCAAIIGFNNEDVLRDDMGCEIICPNCGNSIKF